MDKCNAGITDRLFMTDTLWGHASGASVLPSSLKGQSDVSFSQFFPSL